MINYTRIITDDEQKILENDLLSVTDWIDKAITGKINNCLIRAAKQYDELAKQKSLVTVPTQILDKASALFVDTDYKNRKTRDMEI